jgi:DNA-binding NarL/FixJ family response regulator
MTQLLRPETDTILISVLPAEMQLNAREQAILAGLFAGQTEAQVADALGISLRTVRRAITEQLLPKFQAHNLRELLVKAAELGRDR